MNNTTPCFHHTLFLALVAAAMNAAEATPISIAITATVRSVDDFSNLLQGTVLPGDIVTGIYTYDSSTPDSNTLEPVGDYNHTESPFGITLHVNGLTFRTDPNNVSFLVELVNDQAGSDNYALQSYNNIFDVTAPGPHVDNQITWQVDDSTLAALSSSAMPLTAPVLADWADSFFGLGIDSTINSGDGDGFYIRSDVTSAVLIPEPASVVLLTFGAAASLLSPRRRPHPIQTNG